MFWTLFYANQLSEFHIICQALYGELYSSVRAMTFFTSGLTNSGDVQRDSRIEFNQLSYLTHLFFIKTIEK
jgi:hypothetical protein